MLNYKKVGVCLVIICLCLFWGLSCFAADAKAVAKKKYFEAEKNYTDLKTYFDGGTIRKSFEPFGQKIICSREKLMGTAIAFKDGLKSQFPRAMRTSEIIFPDGGIIEDKSAPKEISD